MASSCSTWVSCAAVVSASLSGRRETESGVCECFGLIKEDSVRTANAFFALSRGIPGKADPWSKVVVAAIRVAFWNSLISVEENSRRRFRKYRGDCNRSKCGEVNVIAFVVLLCLGKGGLPAHSAVDVEILCHLKVVFRS